MTRPSRTSINSTLDEVVTGIVAKARHYRNARAYALGQGDIGDASGREFRKAQTAITREAIASEAAPVFRAVDSWTALTGLTVAATRGLKALPRGRTRPRRPRLREAENFVAPTSSLRGTQFSQNVRRYMDAIEQHTGFRLHPSQRARLADDLRTTNYSRLSPEAGRVHRRGFTQRVREAQIAEWERQTGQAWPRYTEEVYTKSGEVYKKIGDPYDAHHVIENIYGGPHEWWNLTPARFPGQHQSGLHLEEIMKTLFP